MKQIHVYTLDLTKIDGSGDFSCPSCGTTISPDDNTEEVFSILEPKVDNHGLEELVIRCNKCKSHIHLIGFSVLQKLEIDEKKRESEKKK
jgi:predicted RNA-binding Zn-ribbon protein involved in translation (DUF1610 family)